MKKAAVLFLVLAILGSSYFAIQMILFLRTPPDREDTEIIFEVRRGDAKSVFSELQKKGVITDSFRFGLLARLTGKSSQIRIGEYRLSTSLEPMEVLNTITSGKSLLHPVTISEGLNMYEIAELLEKKHLTTQTEFLTQVRNKALIKELLKEDHETLEGYLFPETYNFTKFTGTKEIIRTMVTRFLQEYRLASGAQIPVPLKNRHEVVTLASIVEKETGAPEERPLVASVFFNRLHKGMKLQTDPTVIYGVWDSTQKPVANIKKDDLLTPSRYNTYTLPGLPFGPISNPGRLAIEAVFKPAQTEFIFFVSQNNGTHVFSKDLNSHNQAVQKFQLDRKQRQGKSWRDLSKRGNEAKPSPTSSQKPPGAGRKK